MLEYFAIKKYRESTAADGTSISKEPLTPLLAPQDERYLAQVIDDPEGTHSEPESVIFNGSPPQAPIATVDPPVKLTTENVQGAAPPTEGDGDWKDTLKEKWGYLEALGSVTATRIEKAVVSTIGMDKGIKEDKGKGKAVDTNADGVESAVETGPHSEILREDKELTDILEGLNCAASNGTVFSSPSAALKPLIGKFTQIFKDLTNGVPTAYDDLISLFDSSNSILEMTYKSLPTFMKQIIQSLPDKMTPEILRTLAATSPALANVGRIGLRDMVTTPGLLAKLLKAIVQTLKTRFPMLMGGGVAVGLGVFVLFFGLWYCYKRGKETREEAEERERMEEFGVERIKTEKELDKEKKDKLKAEKKAKEQKEKEAAGPAKKSWWGSK